MAMTPAPTVAEFFSLAEAMKRPGCPVCLRLAQEMGRTIQGFVQESVNDPRVREKICREGGLCHRHTWRLMEFHDEAGVAALFREVLNASADLLAGWRPQRRLFGLQFQKHEQRCLFCWLDIQSLGQLLRIMVSTIDESPTGVSWDGPALLCVPHLRQVCACLRDDQTRQRLLNLHREKYANLSTEPGRLFGQHAYALQAYDGTKPARWIRAAAAVLVGRCESQ